MRQTIKQTISLIRSDMQTRCNYENKALNVRQVLKFFLHSGAICCMVYRWQIFFYTNHLGFFAGLCKLFNSVVFTVDIDSKTEIGPGFFPLHRCYIVIGPNVKIGKNCMMAHQNAVCASPFYSAATVDSRQGPTIGDDVVMGGGACITGNITIGNNVHVSMNASVEKSFPDNVVLFGVPAKVVARINQTNPQVEELT
jgi:serine acetyltransferase